MRVLVEGNYLILYRVTEKSVEIVRIVHGARDWMFPVDMAREAAQALAQAGAAVTYRELDDLSHTYPRELNGPLLAWMRET